jgi:hypothetical protein
MVQCNERMRIYETSIRFRRISESVIIFFFCCLVLFSLGCTKEEVVAPPEGKPVLNLSANTSAEKTIKPGEAFITLVTVKRGSKKLRGISIFENNTLAEPERVKINNKLILGNPHFFMEDNNENISLRIEINSLRANNNFVYKFVVSDFGGETAEASRTISVKSDPPKLRFNGPNLTIATINQVARFKLNGVKGSGLLKSLEVLQNNVKVDPARLSFGSLSPASNPFLLDGTDASVFDKDLIVQSPSQAANYTYTFILRDDLDAAGIDSAKVLAGIPAVELVSKNLYNAARGSNFGGIILKDGTSVGEKNVLADILDTGIDTTVTNNSLNWKRQIRAGQNTEIRRIIVGTNGIPQNFSYINIFTKEQIADLFSKGVIFTQKDKEDRLISDPIQIGQIYVVKKDAEFYLIEIAGVIQTATDNEDYYRLNYKF